MEEIDTRPTRTKRKIVIAASAALLLAGGGAAYAYRTATGTGVGEGTTGVSTSFTIASDPPLGDPLIPGGDPQTVGFTVTNPSDGPQTLESVVVTIAEADGTVWNDVPGCSAADFTVGDPVITYGEILAGDTSDGTVTLEMINSGTNQNACQDADVPLYFEANLPD